MSEILEVTDLRKSYKEKEAVKGINFEVHAGEILCILGPNGAGKSTTINMLTGALHPNGGRIVSALTQGQEIHSQLKAFKRELGIVPQDLAIYEDLSAEDNVQFFASLYGLRGKELKERCVYALSFVGLLDHADEKAKTFSGGMKRRLNIACAIAHKPSLLIMDEPTVGIDPQSRNHILESIKRLRDEGMTIIYTTHYMEEVEEISTRIIIVDHGEIIAMGTKESLKADIESEKIVLVEGEGVERLDFQVVTAVKGVTDVELADGVLRVVSLRDEENLDDIIAALLEQKVKISNIQSQAVSLETVFLNLTGRTLRD